MRHARRRTRSDRCGAVWSEEGWSGPLLPRPLPLHVSRHRALHESWACIPHWAGLDCGLAVGRTRICSVRSLDGRPHARTPPSASRIRDSSEQLRRTLPGVAELLFLSRSARSGLQYRAGRSCDERTARRVGDAPGGETGENRPGARCHGFGLSHELVLGNIRGTRSQRTDGG